MLPQSERDALVHKHANYARTLALDIARGLPSFVSRDDLIAVARAGLVEAATRFDPKRGAQFATFAYYRIRGAVYDHVRKLAQGDPYNRARASAAAAAAVDDLIESRLAGRARAANEGPADAAELLAGVIDDAATAFAVADCAEALVAAGSRTDTEGDAARLEAARALDGAIDALPEKERALVRAVYLDGATIEEAGAAMGLSKSWASRLHARALSLLRERVPEHAPA